MSAQSQSMGTIGVESILGEGGTLPCEPLYGAVREKFGREKYNQIHNSASVSLAGDVVWGSVPERATNFQFCSQEIKFIDTRIVVVFHSTYTPAIGTSINMAGWSSDLSGIWPVELI